MADISKDRVIAREKVNSILNKNNTVKAEIAKKASSCSNMMSKRKK